MAMAVSISTLLASIKEAGLSSATIQAQNLTHAQVNAMFWINSLLGVSVGCLSVIVGAVSAWWLSQPQLAKIIPAMGVVGAIECLSIQHSALLQRRMEFQKLVTQQLVARIASVTVGITAAFQGAGVWSLVLMQIVSATVGTASLWVNCKWRPSGLSNLKAAYPMLRFGTAILAERVLAQATRGLDSIVIGHYYGSEATGLYARAQNLIAKPLARAMTPIMNVSRPALSRAAENPTRLSNAARELLGLISVASALLVVILVVGSEGIVRIMLGSAWDKAIPIFAALACFALVEPCASVTASMLVSSGHPGALLRWRTFSALSVIVGLLLAAPHGVIVIAVTYAGMGLVVRTPLFLWYASGIIGIPFKQLFGLVFRPALLAGVSISISLFVRQYLTDPGSFFNMILLISTGGGLYLLGCFTLTSFRHVTMLWRQHIVALAFPSPPRIQ